MSEPASRIFRQFILTLAVGIIFAASLGAGDKGSARPGYYRYPAIHGDTIIFTAEGDLWSVSAKGGAARRLTSSPGKEFHAAISPDGQTVAFSAEYEGPVDVYTMLVDGGLPQRRTWDGNAFVAGWTPDGRRGFFHPDVWTFGQQLKASQIDGRVLSVEGVEHVISVTMKRFNNPSGFSDEITNVNYNEILQVLNDRNHMEKGFIDFDVQGGRR